MNDKTQLVTMLREEFKRWEALLADMSEEQIIAPTLSANLSVKDVIAHLRTWQQISIGRLEAALQNKEPEFPQWLAQFGPDWEEDDPDPINAWAYEMYRNQLWSSVHRDWKEGFFRFLELAEQIPEQDLMAAERYSWLRGYPLFAVLEGSLEHHQDHLEPLLEWRREHENSKFAE